MTYDPYADTRSERERMVVERVERDTTPPTVRRTRPVDTAPRLVWRLFGVLQALIALRIVLLLIGVNEGNDLVGLVAGISDPLVRPFGGMFSLDEVSGASGSVLDVAAIVALVAWTLVEALVLGIVGLADPRPPSPDTRPVSPPIR